jgi:hypothetical protein
LKTFQQHQEHDKTHHGLGDFIVTNKSNKLPSFIDKDYLSYSLSSTIIVEEAMAKLFTKSRYEK